MQLKVKVCQQSDLKSLYIPIFIVKSLYIPIFIAKSLYIKGMIRSSVTPTSASKQPGQGTFTPAIRQFSAPKNVKSLEE